MAGNDSKPRSIREGLAAELLESCDEMLTKHEQILVKIEQVQQTLPAVVEQSVAHVAKERENATASLRKLAQDARIEMDKDTMALAQKNYALAQEIKSTVAAFRAESRRLFWRTLMAGALGGILAVAAFAGVVWFMLP